MPSHILAFQALLVMCGTAAFIASLQFVRRLLELRQERTPSIPTTELRERLDRIEIAVEATALEVERISEANRFMAKLLADRSAAAVPSGRPERVITPH
jgi:hypothetical protein